MMVSGAIHTANKPPAERRLLKVERREREEGRRVGNFVIGHLRNRSLAN